MLLVPSCDPISPFPCPFGLKCERSGQPLGIDCTHGFEINHWYHNPALIPSYKFAIINNLHVFVLPARPPFVARCWFYRPAKITCRLGCVLPPEGSSETTTRVKSVGSSE